ncbi:MAG TPA: hypothetical protein VK277_10875 [Acidimicrobiales bacterium]|nr:hypothetical protein [Acidimicrobiales bacterium]
MSAAFWALVGAFVGFALSFGLWYVTAKVLVAHLALPEQVTERVDKEGRYSYSFTISNTGQRDAIDITVTCTLHSTGWGSDRPGFTALITIPMRQNGQITVIRGQHALRRRLGMTRPLDRYAGRNVAVSFNLGDVSDFQKEKLKEQGDVLARLNENRVRLQELMELGQDSFLNIVVFANDRFSGSRNVFTDVALRAEDVTPG